MSTLTGVRAVAPAPRATVEGRVESRVESQAQAHAHAHAHAHDHGHDHDHDHAQAQAQAQARVEARPERQGERRAQGVVVTCFPVRGGAGSTTLAVNLAGELAARGKRVVVVDLDLHLGDASLMLDVDLRASLADLLGNLDRLDGELLRTSLAAHRSGVFVLGQGDRLEEADRITPDDARRLVLFLRGHFDYLVLDGVRGFDEMSLQALDLADRILLVLTQDVPSVKNAARCLEVMRRLHYDAERISLVANRVQRRGAAIELETVESHLKARLAARITSDPEAVSTAIDHGRLLAEAAPRAQVTRDVAALATALAGDGAGETGRGLFGRLFRRRSGG